MGSGWGWPLAGSLEGEGLAEVTYPTPLSHCEHGEAADFATTASRGAAS